MSTIRKPEIPAVSKPKRCVSVYTLPESSNPLVRVEVLKRCISAGWLFNTCCDTIGLYKNSRQFFALFRGLARPLKKYESQEHILVPVKTYPLSILRWSFDITLECKMIQTDPVALKLLALQYKSDVDNGIKTLVSQDLERLGECEDPQFMCYKQYVDIARTIEGYDSVTIRNVEVVEKVKFVSQVIAKGAKVDVVCNAKGMTFVSS